MGAGHEVITMAEVRHGCCAQDNETVLEYLIQRGEALKALAVLRRPGVSQELVYKFAPVDFVRGFFFHMRLRTHHLTCCCCSEPPLAPSGGVQSKCTCSAANKAELLTGPAWCVLLHEQQCQKPLIETPW
jgi:hypothetical protein